MPAYYEKRPSELKWTWKSRTNEDNHFGVFSDEHLKMESDAMFHNGFVEGRSLPTTLMFYERPEEWIPNMLPAPVRMAKASEVPQLMYGDQSLNPLSPAPRNNPRSTKIGNTVGDDINSFSDPERASSVLRDQEPDNKQSSQQLSQNSLVLGNVNSYGLRQITFSPPQQSFSIAAGQDMAGRGRGRGGGGGGMLKGATWEYDASIKLESKPTDLFPVHPNLRRPAPITAKERREVNNYKTLQDLIHRGPLYTQPTKRDPNAPAKTFGEEQFNRQYGTNRKADMDPFHGVETYSMRYAPKQRDLPKLSDQSFNKNLFPSELWATLEGTEGQEVRNHINRAMQKKALFASANGDTSQKTRLVLEKIHNVAGDDDNEELDEEVADAEEADDAYDDDDLGDDYNAEGYFDDGENEMDDDVDGGGGGGDDY